MTAFASRWAGQHQKILGELQKAVTAASIANIVPEDLEVEAHNLLWTETSPDELTLMKMLPSVTATQIVHEVPRITSYGNVKGSGHFAETSLPGETNFGNDRFTVNIRLIGEIGPTYLLASLEETVQALGSRDPAEIQRVALRRNLLFKKARNCYLDDTRPVREGVNGLRTKGLLQQIEEGTDGTTGTSPFGSHVIDMEGDPLTVDTIRERMARGTRLFGQFNNLYMDPFVRSDFEKTLDGAQRLNFPIQASPYMLGQHIGGIQTNGGVVRFHTDNVLSPDRLKPQYSADLEQGAPTTRPTITTAATTPVEAAAKFNAADAGSYRYGVTEIVLEKEGVITELPAAVAVAAGDKVTFGVTPGNALADTYRVYRSPDADYTDSSDLWFIFDVAGDGTGAEVTIDDLNEWRENTGIAFGLRLMSGAQQALSAAAGPEGYYAAAARSSSFFNMQDTMGQNTVAAVHLGPQMGIMQLAKILATPDRPLMYSACAWEVRNPLQNVAFKNIGRLS